MAPRFSVVIPTRNRSTTLPAALRTCFRQSFQDFEVVVSDNSTDERTSELLRAEQDPRLQVVRAPRSLSMSHNFELALSRCRGEFVVFLGDDDGLMPGALAEVDRLLAQTEARALRWDLATYGWPNIPLQADANVLVLSTNRTLERVDGLTRVREASRSPATARLPMVYHGAVARSLLEQLRGPSGAFFRGRYPDIYSGFTIAGTVGEFWEVTVPLSIAGLSAQSTGVAVLLQPEEDETSARVREAFVLMNTEDGLDTEPGVPDLGTGVAVVLDSFFVARRHHFSGAPDTQVEARLVARALLASIWSQDAAQRGAQIGRVRGLLHGREDLAWFDRLAAEHVATPPRLTPDARGVLGDALIVDAGPFGVRDVDDAAVLASRLLGLDAGPLRYDQPPRAALMERERTYWQRALRECQADLERERAALRSSLSWRVTAPLRSFRGAAGRLAKLLGVSS